MKRFLSLNSMMRSTITYLRDMRETRDKRDAQENELAIPAELYISRFSRPSRPLALFHPRHAAHTFDDGL